jgi:dipeptidyl aminopeptidase/acylaminoacyl peptidase
MIATSLILPLLALPFQSDEPAAAPSAESVAEPAKEKRRLEHEDALAWRSLISPTLSRDGAWLLYRVTQEDEPDVLHVHAVQGDAHHTMERVGSASFDAASAFVALLIRPDEDEVKAAREKEEKPPPTQVGLLSLPDLVLETIDDVRGFRLPGEGGGWVAYQRTAASEEPEGVQELRKGKPSGYDLVLREVATGAEHAFPHVVSYEFDPHGRRLALVTSSKDGAADGVHVWTLGERAPEQILGGPCEVRSVAWDEAGEQLVFLTDLEDFGAEDPTWSVHHWSGHGRALHVAAAGDAGVPDGWTVAERRGPSFSASGKRILFHTAPVPETPPEVPDDEKVVVDVWSWTDDRIQPEQLSQLSRDRNRTYLAVAHVHAGAPRLVQLATAEQPDASLSEEGDGRLALASTDLPYRKESSWASQVPRDVWLVDALSGDRRRVIERRRGRFSLSPGGRFVTWWDGEARAYFAYTVASGEVRNLTERIPHRLDDELHDEPQLPRSYGTAGWLAEDEGLLVYDRYDVWLCDPAGRFEPRCVTEGVGREERTRLRVLRLDSEEPWLDPAEDFLLTAFDERTKDGGFWRDRVAGAEPPEVLLEGPYRYGTPRKAEDADVIRFTRESFAEYPDVWVAGPDFSGARKLSDTNPQQAEFLWGSEELWTWSTDDGERLDGILAKPEGFDPEVRYPLLVYFYERSSDRLHSHSTPVAGGSSVKYPFYTSRGYVVFVPDIPYEVGYPGRSAERAVLSGVRSLIDAGIADAERIGVQGHSWGGYQIAHLVTRTDLFACAIAGAPVSNMTSAYGGIRWSTGKSRMFQYENTQSRIGATLWDSLELYLENSPLFHADGVTTPLLMLHNDEDGAVPWYQGIEYFVALRRLGWPVWLLNYNGEGHGLGKPQNRRDYAVRMQQFLDHHCLDAPAPKWMAEGVPAVRKGYELGLEAAGADER